MTWLWLVAGASLGGVSRYVVGSAVHHVVPTEFPLGTLVVNAVGCLVVGFLSAAGGAQFNLTHQARLFLVTGFCGAFTTFSAMVLEAEALFRNGSPVLAAGYVALSLVLGFSFFALGLVCGRGIF